MIPMIVLILVQFSLGAQAQSVGQCLDNLMKSAKDGGNLCPVAEEYIRCVFVELNFQSTNFSETDLTSLENEMEKTLSAGGIHCNIDIRAILRKVNEDASNAATRTTKKPTGYDGATTIGDCLNTFTGASTQAGSPSCSLVTPFLKCLIRVTELYKYETSSNLYSSTEAQIENTFRSIGLNCNFDIKQMSAEVASEQKYRNSESGLHTSVRGMLSLYTVTVAAWICSFLFLY